jgi:hypothetical protein
LEDFVPNASAILRVLPLLASALISTSAAAQQIYKWTDANGQVHYTDHPPADRSAAPVAVDKRPSAAPPPPLQPAQNRDLQRQDSESFGQGASQVDNRSAADRRLEAATEDYERRKLAAQRDGERLAAEKAAEAEVIARCERARDTHCNKGADYIKKREEDLAGWQHMDRKQRWIDGGRVGPRPQAPPAPAPRYPDEKKKK